LHGLLDHHVQPGDRLFPVRHLGARTLLDDPDLDPQLANDPIPRRFIERVRSCNIESQFGS
jgi:hypothetical protein